MSKTYPTSGTNCYGQFYGEPIPMDKMTDAQWAICIRRYRRSGKSAWREEAYGAYPMTPACRAPIELQKASDETLKRLVDKLREDNRPSQY